MKHETCCVLHRAYARKMFHVSGFTFYENMPNQRPQTNSRPQERQKPSDGFEQKLLDVARVARVTAGGRRFSFRATVVIGDRAGNVGVGVKKGKDVQFAVEKAVSSAKRNLVKVPITNRGTIPHEIYGKFGSSLIFMKPAKEGSGIKAGGAVRTVCDLAGYQNIVAKILSRSGNKLNIARATIEALSKIKHVPEPKKKEALKKDSDNNKDNEKNKKKGDKKSS